MNHATFFARVRANPFGGKLSHAQVSGMSEILGAAVAMGFDLRNTVQRAELGYCLGTTYHETAATMQPVRESGGPAYYHRMYDPRSPDRHRASIAARMGARPGDGVIYYGRGYVQLTWRFNYARMGKKLGIDLEKDPDRACEAGVAAAIMFTGMRDGDFTGRRLSQHFTPTSFDWVGARRIINGMDRAELIAGQARAFFEALNAAAA